MLFLASVLCIIYGLFVILRWRKQRGRLLELAAQVPTYEGCLPLIGHAYKLVGDNDKIWEMLKSVIIAAGKAGGVLNFWLGPNLFYVINDPDDGLTVLNTCLQRQYFYKFVEPWLGSSLFTADVPLWKQNRKLLNPAFNQHVLDGFVYAFNHLAKELVNDFELYVGKGDFNPRACLSQYTLQSITHTALGISFDEKNLIDENYVHVLERMLSLQVIRVSNIWMHPSFIYKMMSLKKEEDELVKFLHNVSMTVIQRRKKERQNAKEANISGRRFKPFLDLLLDMADEGLFTEEGVRAEIDTLIVGGHDTCSRTLHSTLILLGTYHDVQDKVYEELTSVLGSKEQIANDDLRKLMYTEAVIKESMRIAPVSPFVFRTIDKEVKLRSYTLPAGCNGLIGIWGILRLPCWGTDAEQFRPERWLSPETLPQSAGAYCSFSAGRRNCIGKNYAYLSMKTAIAHVIRKYRVKADFSKYKVVFDSFLKPVAGYEIALEYR